MKALAHATESILTVSPDSGRGFVVATERECYVITAAHCLPRLPVPHPWATEERTYRNQSGRSGTKPCVWAECVFVDPVADIAVLAQPDGQELFEEYEAFDELVKSATPLQIATCLPRFESQAFLFSLDNDWFPCKAIGHRRLCIKDAGKGILGGMSGSPILNHEGAAIGVVSCGSDDRPTEGGPHPRLDYNLPGWLLRELEIFDT